MKKIWKYLKAHFKEDFDPNTYVSVSIFLAVAIVTNYITDFEDSILDSFTGVTKYVLYLLFYSLPYYFSVFIVTRKSKHPVWTSQFFFKSAFGLMVLSLDASMPFLRAMISGARVEIYYWLYKVTVNLISIVTVLTPLFLYYCFFEKKKEGFYGLTPQKFDISPYIQMLLLMIPVLIAATWLPGFLTQYPMYKVNEAHEYFGVPAFVTALSYEFAYGFDFVTVELLFRGFMVIGMSALLGRKAILPMAVIYCFLHFGKPAGEAVSSIFGGYILGVIAYETRSIWGGVIVHVGIAWLMEIISLIAKTIRVE